MKIVFIGAGNLATQISKALTNCPETEILQIYSKTESSAKLLAETINTSYTIDLNNIREDADLYIFSVKDAVLEDVLNNIKPNKGIWVHTAGSIPMSVFKPYTDKYGVFYPLQTFSKNRDIDLSDVPFFIEGANPAIEDTLLWLAKQLSKNVRLLDSNKRKEIHLAAVFVCNFTNHMYAIAADILDTKGIPFDVLVPLINETTAKLSFLHPKDAQTGPAIRYDQNVINKHTDMLPEKYKELYRLISKSIYKMYKE